MRVPAPTPGHLRRMAEGAEKYAETLERHAEASRRRAGTYRAMARADPETRKQWWLYGKKG
jgi:hypothetical protein